jgi:hypothetical protein
MKLAECLRPMSIGLSIARLSILICGATVLSTGHAVAGSCDQCQSTTGPCTSSSQGYSYCGMVGSACYNLGSTCS